MSLDFFIDKSIEIAQNTTLTAVKIERNTNMYDYILDISIADAGHDTMNNLFNVRNYVQDQEKPNEYISILKVNNTVLNAVLMTPKVQVKTTRVDDVGLTSAWTNWDKTASQSLGQRLLEIVATKIFGNPLTTAAIVNDTDFTKQEGPTATVTTGVHSALVSSNNDFFNLYVATDRIQQDQSNLGSNGDEIHDFLYNMNGLTLEFPMNLSGTLIDQKTTNPVNTSAFAGLVAGPNMGGSTLSSGAYRVPILLRLRN
jgi:hypothetical protein